VLVWGFLPAANERSEIAGDHRQQAGPCGSNPRGKRARARAMTAPSASARSSCISGGRTPRPSLALQRHHAPSNVDDRAGVRFRLAEAHPEPRAGDAPLTSIQGYNREKPPKRPKPSRFIALEKVVKLPPSQTRLRAPARPVGVERLLRLGHTCRRFWSQGLRNDTPSHFAGHAHRLCTIVRPSRLLSMASASRYTRRQVF